MFSFLKEGEGLDRTLYVYVIYILKTYDSLIMAGICVSKIFCVRYVVWNNCGLSILNHWVMILTLVPSTFTNSYCYCNYCYYSKTDNVVDTQKKCTLQRRSNFKACFYRSIGTIIAATILGKYEYGQLLYGLAMHNPSGLL